ncbi:MAG: ammonia channel protein, partial [Bilophila wadsworthia]
MLSLNTGDTGFVMLCTALVCMMTPALALFYGGMVRKKNVLSLNTGDTGFVMLCTALV